MANKKAVPSPGNDRNDDERRGEAYEPEDAGGDTSFNPAELEASGPAELNPPPARDPYDPAFLGLGQDFAKEADVAKKWDMIKVEKPTKSRVFRVHLSMRLKTMLLTLKEDNETYLVLPQLHAALRNESLCGLHTLFPYITKAGTPFLWAIRMPDSDGKWNIWHQSAWQIAENAQKRWARMQANREAGYYVADYDQRPVEQQYEPAWPDLAFRDWLELAFRGYTIDSLDHPILKRLRMED
jgi:hypothetical protein